MTLSDLLDLSKLEKHVADGEIKSRRHNTEPLTIYNYSARCQFEKIWTHETKTCRGLIVDDLGDVVARPFAKFFNLGEHSDAPPLHEPHSIYEKLDGSLGVAYVRARDGRTAIATRGAFHSPQAEHATELLQSRYPFWLPPSGETWLFEIIYAGSRVVVDYGDMDELVLLARIDTEKGRDLPIDSVPHPFRMAKRFEMDWSKMLESQRVMRGLSSEGFVVRFHESGLRLKVKTDDYMRLHRLVCGLSTRAVWEVLSTGASMDDFLAAVPDEFMEWVKAKAAELRTRFAIIEEECRLVTADARALYDRKAQAEIINARAEHPAVCFKMLGGQRDDKPGNYAPLIWKLLYPPHETFRAVNEDAA
jgi:RNA ligase